MNRVLRKRLLRDLKSNFGRYAALILLIVMGIFIVLSLSDSAESVIQGTENMKSVNMVEDGQFTVFLPLTDEEKEKISKNGTVIEEMFYSDLPVEGGKTLRLFKNREKIDLIQLTEGRLAESGSEAVLERRFAAENGYKCGDTVIAGGEEFDIVGIGTVPDYDHPLKSLADTCATSEDFGLIFTTAENYDRIRSESVQSAEEYVYAYRLGEKFSDDDLKDEIKSLDFDWKKVEDKYFRESIDEVLEDRREIEKGYDDLTDGTVQLNDGLKELDGNSQKLKDGAQELLDGYLSQAQASLAAMGANVVLTEKNYAEELDKIYKASKQEQIKSLKESLDGIKEFRDGINEYTDGVNEAYDGSGELKDGVADKRSDIDEMLDEVFDIDIDNLTGFLKQSDNQRIGGAAEDVLTNKMAGLTAGVILLILISYVISVFVVHQIERESSVIGSLYALGVKKKDLLRHYITLPSVIAFIGGALGFALALTPIGIKVQIGSSSGYFSIPDFDIVMPWYYIVYAFVIPPLISAAVNALVINKRLSRPTLSLIKNEQSASSYRQFRIRSKSFPKIFRIRQTVREMRSAITVVLGMFFSLLVITLGLTTYTFCNNVKIYNVKETKYEYMYLYKYPEKKVPEGGEGIYIKTLSTDLTGAPLDVSVIGIDGRSKYFDAIVEKGKNRAVVSNSLNERFGFTEGDRVTFSDKAADTDYSFTVTDVCNYSPGFTIFMDIESMRELFGEDEDYFNAVLSDKELDIDEGRIYSITTKDNIRKTASVFIDQMKPLMTTLFIAGSAIFCVVMYLMLGVMIDRSAFGISLIKIFGYRSKEVRSLYLNGNLLIVMLGGLICIPAAKSVINMIYPSFVTNVASCMKMSLTWRQFVLIYSAMLVIYLVINELLFLKIKRITPAEVLKNRE
ncbi:MAG: FtsX-like permease family protein [Ruminococcus sp.]|nr:FtsX-like permease family protein [Ruminococcus sp.]